MSQDPGDDSASDPELVEASRRFLSDLQAVAHAARQVISSAPAREQIDAAWLQGFGESLATLQSSFIARGSPFPDGRVGKVQLLGRLNLLHSHVKDVIFGPSKLALSKYLEQSAKIIHLFKMKPGIDPSILDIEFLLETLEFALDDPLQGSIEIEAERSQATTPNAVKRKIYIFVAADKAGEDAANQLAIKLGQFKVGQLAINVIQSWLVLPDLSTRALPAMVSAINRCQYGALVLLPEEATTDVADTNSGTTGMQHLRLPANLEFLLGLMVGRLAIDNTFLVVPETEKAQLSELLTGLVPAAYDPDELDSDAAMDGVCSHIRKTISTREKMR